MVWCVDIHVRGVVGVGWVSEGVCVVWDCVTGWVEWVAYRRGGGRVFNPECKCTYVLAILYP